MPTYNPFEFQQVAIEKLVSVFKNLWAQAPKTDKPIDLVFKSPTGSGKTFMLTHFVNSMLTQPDWHEDMAWVWITFSDHLAMQSREKFTQFLFPNIGNQLLTIDDFRKGLLEKNDILFLNWQKLVSKCAADRLNRRPEDPDLHKETGFYFEDVIERTHAQGRAIVMIIDESHKNVTEASWRDVIQKIAPRILLKVSATPEYVPNASDVSHFRAGFVEVERKDVVEAGLIKDEVISQTEDDLNQFKQKDNDLLMLDLAIEKRRQIADEWKRIGQNINPLVLIQLPNDEKKLKETNMKSKEEVVVEYLLRNGVSSDRIARWFDDKKVNMDDIDQPDNKVEYMLFKYAAGTGWDCPRAHILVMYREIQSNTFKTQTIGRILRNPLPGNGLDDYPVLRTGYLFTNYKRNEVESANYAGSNAPKTKSAKLEVVHKQQFVAADFAQKTANDLIKHLADEPQVKEQISAAQTSICQKTKEITKELHLISTSDIDDLQKQEKIRAKTNELHEHVQKQISFVDDTKAKDVIVQHVRENVQEVQNTIVENHETQFVLDPCLISDFIPRAEYGDLGKSSEFQVTLRESLDAFFVIDRYDSSDTINEKLQLKGVDAEPILEQDVMVNARFRSDVEDELNEDGKNVKYEMSSHDVEKEFTFCCYQLINELGGEAFVTNVARSWGTLKEALRQWFISLNLFADTVDYYRIFLKDIYRSNSAFRCAIRTAMQNYKPKLEDFRRSRQDQKEREESKPFAIKTHYAFSKDDKEYPTQRSIVRPLFLPEKYSGRDNETMFIDFIDSKLSIDWWFKNGDSGKDFLGFRYTDSQQGKERVFYPDWLIKFTDGRIGIFDTKGGQTAASPETADKANALQSRLALLCEQSKLYRYFGGIAVEHAGVWYYNDSPNYSYVDFPKGWKVLEV